MALLEVQHLKKYFATQKAVDDISLTIEKGSIFGLLGPNGAGKTTLIRMITGIFYPDEGTIRLDGKVFDPVNDVGQIGYMPEEQALAETYLATDFQEPIIGRERLRIELIAAVLLYPGE